MVAQNTAETDEQIIDLTELIEKGEVPASDPSVQAQAHAAAEAEAEKEELQEHLRDLNDGAAKADAEIDDLLAQMDIKVDAQEDPADVALDFSAPSTQTDHHIDPNEQLNMPGMGEVDSLLNSLDIPPQPSEREAEVASPDSTDPAVDALLNDFNAPAAPAAAPVAVNHEAPDLDELLASAGAAPQSDTSSQIDDLLNEASPAAPVAAPVAAPQKTFSNDDLDSLLEAAGGQASAPSPIMTAAPAPQPVAAPQPAPSPSMDIDIDSLLAAAANDLQHIDNAEPAAAPANAPAQPDTVQPAPVQPAPVQAAPADMGADMGVDIDSLLAAAANDLQQNLDAAVPESAPTAAPAPATPTDPLSNDDLDSLLAAAAADLDTEPSPAPASAPQVAPASADAGLDIDSLLAAAANDLEQTLDPVQPEAPATPEAMLETNSEIATEAQAAPQPDLDLDLDSLLAAVDAHAAPQPAAEPEPAPEEADPFAAAQQAVAEAVPVQPEAAPLPDIETELMQEAQPEPVFDPAADLTFEPDGQPEISADALPDGTDILPENPAQDAAAETAAEIAADTPAATEAVTESNAETVVEPAADIEAMMAAASGEAFATDSLAEQDIPAESVDDLLAAMSADLSEEPVADTSLETAAQGEPSVEDSLLLLEPVAESDEEFAEEPMDQADPYAVIEAAVDTAADVATEAAAEAEIARLLPEIHDAETSPAALAAQQLDDADPTGLESQAALDATLAAVSAEALEAVMTQANEASSHALDAFAQAFDASTRAADAASAVDTLAARVEHCERALQEAGERIIALETALESQIAALHNLTATALPRQELEGMFMEGHPLHQGLMECISKAVAETLAAAPATAPTDALAPAQHTTADVQALIDEHLQPVITAARIATARIDSLESRLDALEPRFNDRVEKAAAAAAARILREEIGRLLEE